MASFLSYTLPIFAKILPNPHTVTKDVAYGNKPDQRLDLYLLNNGKLNPTIIFVHGGGWGAGDKSAYEGRAKKYGLAGFNVVSIDYTLATSDPNTHWDAQLQDIKNGELSFAAYVQYRKALLTEFQSTNDMIVNQYHLEQLK